MFSMHTAFKVCKTCGQLKPLDSFHTHPKCLDGHVGTCKLCKAAYAKRRYATIRPAVTGDATKACRKCGAVKLITDGFHRHGSAKDGYLNVCKRCTVSGAQQRYRDNLDARRAYGAARERDPERRARQVIYGMRSEQRHPEKAKARRLARYAIATGKLIKEPCRFCGENKVQAHHEDYSKPLDVWWVCDFCHRTVCHRDRYSVLAEVGR